jgi:hypothetical protein
MSKSIKVLLFDKQSVGKRIKSSKKRFLWRFEIDGNQHQVDLYCSRLSGRRKLFFDGDLKHDTYTTGGMGTSYPIRYGRHVFLIVQVGDCDYDLRIDNLSFKEMLSKQKEPTFDNIQQLKSMDDEWKTYSYDEFKPAEVTYRRSESEYIKTKIEPKSIEPQIRKETSTQNLRAEVHGTGNGTAKILESKSMNMKKQEKVEFTKSESMPAQIDLFDPNVSYKNGIPDDLFDPAPKPTQSDNPFERRKTYFDHGNPSTTSKDAEESLLDFNSTPNTVQASGASVQYPVGMNPMMYNQMMTNSMMYNSMMTNPMMANPMMTNPMMANPMMTNPMMANPMMANPMMTNQMMINPFATGMMMNQMMRGNNPYMNPPQ